MASSGRPGSATPAEGSLANGAVRRIEPIKFYLTLQLCIAVACLMALAVLNRGMDGELEQYTNQQTRHHTISEVSLITQKSLLRIQGGFESLLLASSEAELDTAEDEILENVKILQNASQFFEQGGEFTETFSVNFDGLERVSHTFQLDGMAVENRLAAIEMRSSLDLLRKALEEYHGYSLRRIKERRSVGAVGQDAQLLLMHKKLYPFFVRATEHSNRLYVQGMRDLKRASAEREQQLRVHNTALVGMSCAALLVLLGTGLLVFRTANRVLDERAFQASETNRANALLRGQIDERVRAEESLRQSEERFRSYFEHSLVGMSITTPDKGWVAINPKQVEMLGYTKEELNQTSWAALTHPDDLEADLEQYRRMLAGEIESFGMDKRFLHKDGSVVHVDLSVSCLRDKTGAVVLVLASYLDITKRVQAEGALKQSEKTLRDLYELAPIGIFSSLPEGRYLSVNQAHADMHGYASPEEMVRLVTDISRQMYMEPGERARMRERLESQGRITDIEVLHKTKTGQPVWVMLNSRTVRDAEGKVLFYEGFAMNVSRRKHAELAEQESQAELRKLWKAVDQSPVSIIITAANGAIQYVNPYFTQLTGYTFEEALGKFPRILKSGIHPQEFFKDLWSTLLSKNVWRGEICNRNKQGELYWEHATISPILSPDGAITNFVAVKEDITEQIRRDAELKSALSELEAIFNSSSVGIAYLDASYLVLRVNALFVELFGLSAQELREQGLSAFFATPELFKTWREEQRETMAQGDMVKAEWQLRSRTGRTIWCSVAARAIDPKRLEAGSIWVFDDITARIDLESMRADVERIMRHDLKAPLNGIINLPVLIAEEGELNESQRELLGLIKDAGLRMLDQIELSLDLYRMESGTYEAAPLEVDLLHVAHSVCKVLGPAIRARRVSVEILVGGRASEPGDSVTALGNELLCHNILLNLLKNAVEASAPGGKVEILLSRQRGWSRMAVHNEGSIPAEIRPIFFEKYSTFGKKGGTGLGTYSARLMTESQGGRISFLNEDAGQGVTIVVELPGVQQGA